MPTSPTLRPSTPADEPFLFELYVSTREDLTSLRFGPTELDMLLKVQFRAQNMSYAANHPNALNEIIVFEGKDVGRVLIDRKDDEILIIDIAILPVYRKHGIGTHFLNAVASEGQALRKSIRLTVFATNPARFLYERLGYVVEGEHSMYLEMVWKGPAASGPPPTD